MYLLDTDICIYLNVDYEAYGVLRSYLEKRGTLIGPYDLQIAAQCLSRSLCLITNNTGVYGRIPHLEMGNWVDGC